MMRSLEIGRVGGREVHRQGLAVARGEHRPGRGSVGENASQGLAVERGRCIKLRHPAQRPR